MHRFDLPDFAFPAGTLWNSTIILADQVLLDRLRKTVAGENMMFTLRTIAGTQRHVLDAKVVTSPLACARVVFTKGRAGVDAEWSVSRLDEIVRDALPELSHDDRVKILSDVTSSYPDILGGGISRNRSFQSNDLDDLVDQVSDELFDFLRYAERRQADFIDEIQNAGRSLQGAEAR